jgi:DNA repair protein RecN (Recombination protein N)
VTIGELEMLRELHVRDLALIEKASLEFGPGLNVLSGETGAGKTVLVEALGLLLGGRGDSSLVRPGEDRLELEAAFELSGGEWLHRMAEEEGFELVEDEIIIRRVISGEGKGRCYVNGRMCTVGTLTRLGEHLVDIHGQHEHQRLLRPASHLGYLDAYGSADHEKLLDSYRELYVDWCGARERLEKASMDEAERLREIDLLRFQVREIEATSPIEGEMEELLKERKRMQNREDLFTAVREAYEAVAGEDDERGALDRLGAAVAAMEKASSLDEDLAVKTRGLREAQALLSDLSYELRDYAETLDFEPGRLEEVEQRLKALSDLARKYGPETALILEHLGRSKERLAELECLDERREALQVELDAAEARLRELAARLTASRTALARKLARETNKELEELNMAGMRFRIEIEDSAEFTARGKDMVEFTVTPGKGMPYRPIARIASGGELSRIMLALKLSLARADDVPTLVFDEIDSGIGGATADVLAEKLSRISAYHQVFSITHLPQIAAYSDRHMAVSKRETTGGVTTEVEVLDADRRIDELIRMLGGGEATAREHAMAMLSRHRKSEV